MSRTTTVKSGSGHLNSAVILGRFLVVLLLVCLFMQSAFAQGFTIAPNDLLTSQPNGGVGLAIGDGVTDGNYIYQDSSGGKDHLELGYAQRGGGIFVINGSSLIFEDAVETNDGGAIAILESVPAAEGVFTFSGGLPGWRNEDFDSYGIFQFNHNIAGDRGGALYNLGSTVNLTLLSFTENESHGVGGQSGGGAIYNDNGTLTLNLVSFTGNKATKFGGAIFNRLGALTVNAVNDPYIRTPYNYYFAGRAQNTFSGNTAQENGGALYNLSAAVVFNARSENANVNDVWDYVANRQNPGPIFSSATGGGTRYSENIFANNRAVRGSGGAIYNNGGTLTFSAIARVYEGPGVTHSGAPSTSNIDGTVNANTAAGATWNSIYNGYYTYANESYATAGLFTGNTASNGGGAPDSGRGGAIFSNGNVTFDAASNAVSATASANAIGGIANSSPVTGSWARTINDTTGGQFERNHADIEGGAVYFTGETLDFTAKSGYAVATANATASAPAGQNETRAAAALSESIALSEARGGVFDENSAGYEIAGRAGNYDGEGGAIFNDDGSDLNFSAEAGYASATAHVTPNGNAAGFGTVGGNATALAASDAVGAEFNDNRARLGGAIYTEQGGTLTFAATLIPNAAAGQEGRNAYAFAQPEPTSSVNDNANYNFLLNGDIPDSNTLGFLDNPISATDPLANGLKSALYDGIYSDRYGSRASSRSTAYGAIFRDNKAAEDGGAIYNQGAELVFSTNNTLTSVAQSTGAVIDIKDANGTVIRQEPHEVAIVANNDVAGTAVDNAAADIAQERTIVTETIVVNRTEDNFPINNNSYRYGYAHAMSDAAAALFEGNIAGGDGGAIYITDGGTMSVTGITRFHNNWAGRQYTGAFGAPIVYDYVGEGLGGAIYNNAETITFNATTANNLTTGYSTFTSNVAEKGGAIYNNDGTVSFWNSTSTSPTRNANLLGGVFGRAGMGNRAVLGGAFYNTQGGTINLTNVRFEENEAVATIEDITRTGDAGFGGAIYNDGGIVNLYGGLYVANKAVSGGAIYHTNTDNPNALLNIDSSGFAGGIRFQFNVATNQGGAIYNDDRLGDLNLSHLDFTGNKAKEGGAIWNAGNANISDAEFIENSKGGTIVATMGGAIYNTTSLSTTEHPTGNMNFAGTNLFQGNMVNEVTGAGGAVYNDRGVLTFTGTNTFVANRAYEGGAIYNNGGTVNITNADFGDSLNNMERSNVASFGGAIYNNTTDAEHVATLVFTDVNFSGNRALEDGGAIYSNGGHITLNVSEGLTSTFEGNKMNVDDGVQGSGDYESIYFAGAGNTLNVNVGAGGTLAMYDPMNGAATAGVTINKTGTGTWELAGHSTFGGDADFNVNEGSLFLQTYNYGTQVSPKVTASKLDLGSGDFSVANATLVVNGAILTTGITPPLTTPPNPADVDASSITTTGGINLQDNSKLVFNNITELDYARSDKLLEDTAVLTLTGSSATVGSSVTVHLVTTPGQDYDFLTAGVQQLNWFDYLQDGGQLRLFSGATPRSNVVDELTWVNEAGITEVWTEERINGSVSSPIVVDGYLQKGTAQARVLNNLYWTGAVDGTWNTTTRNWYGNSGANGTGGTVFSYTFYTNDAVIFDNSYIDENGDIQSNIPYKTITLAGNTQTGGINVLGDDYVFNIAAGQTLSAVVDPANGNPNAGSINFGNATVNLLGTGSTVTAARDISFGDAIVTMTNDSVITATGDININGDVTFGTTANAITKGTTITATNNINFNAGSNSNFVFDLTGADTTNAILNLVGNIQVDVAAGGKKVGSGRIDIANFDGSTSPIILIDTNTNESVTDTGLLYINGSEVVNNRGVGDYMTGLGLGENGSQLRLVTVDADLNSQNLYWTGASGSDAWNTTAANWSGIVSDGTSEMRVRTFLNGDDVIFADQADGNVVDAANKTVRPTANVTVNTMDVTGSGYTFDLTAGNVTATNGIDFGNGSRIISNQGTTIAAGQGGINFGTDTVFEFNLSGASLTDPILTLDGTVTGEKIGSGDIYITNDDLAVGDQIVLAYTDTTGSTVATGNIYIGGTAYPVPERGAGEIMLTLDTNATNSELLLVALDGGQNTSLTWTGVDDGTANANSNWSSGNANTNWTGNVGAANVTTFLNGDDVSFAQASNKVVNLADNVTVGSMTVSSTGYEFDLANGGIHATETIDLGDATVIVYLDETTTEEGTTFAMRNTIVSEGTITLGGTTIAVNASEIDAEVFRDGVDIEVMTAVSFAPGSWATDDVTMESNTNPLLVGKFYLDETNTHGYVRLGLYDFADAVYDFHHNTTAAVEALNVLAYAKWGDAQWDSIMKNTNRAIHQLRGTELVADALGAAMWSPWEITHRRMRTTRDDSGWNTWGEGYYRTGHVSSDDNAMSYDFSRGGTMIGADFGANRNWHIGGAFGYGLPGVENEFGKIDGDDLTVGMYSKINFFDTAAVTTFFGYGYQNYEMERHDFAGMHKGDFGGDALYASVEFAKPIQSQWGVILPLIALDHQTAWTKKFNETGNSTWNQAVSGASMERTMVRFGVDGKWQSAGSVALMSRLQAGFLLDGDEYATVQTHFPGSTASMSLRGSEIGALQVNAGISATGEYRQRYNWFFDLDGYLTGRSYAVQGQLGLSTRW